MLKIKTTFLALVYVFTAFYALTSQAAVYEKWNSGEPNDSGLGGEDCAVMNDSGRWNDADGNFADCVQAIGNRNVACYNGKSWQIKNGNLLAKDECQSLGSDYFYAAPFNDYENNRLKIILNAIDGSNSVYINLTDGGTEGTFESNTLDTPPPYITRWRGSDPEYLDEPDDRADAAQGGSENADCIAVDKQGFWQDTSCSVSLRAVCRSGAGNNENDWQVSTLSASSSELYAGDNLCKRSNGAWEFKAPANDTQNRIMWKKLRVYMSSGELLWINGQDRKKEGDFVTNENLTYWGGGQPDNWTGSSPNGEDCATSNGQNWNDLTCTNSAAYACYRLGNNTWQITGNGQWSGGFAACKALGPEYTFWAPINDSQMSQLDAATNAQVWINVTDQNSETNGNPTTLWEINNNVTFWGRDEGVDQPDNLNNQDCAVMNLDGTWSDAGCFERFPFACYDELNNDWKLASSQANADLYTGDQLCNSLTADNRFHFAAPKNRDELIDLLQIVGDRVWINATDRVQEDEGGAAQDIWEYNDYLLNWQPNEPLANGDDLDCAIAEGTQSGRWKSVDCGASYRFLCYNPGTTSWQLTGSAVVNATIDTGAQQCGSGLQFIAPKNEADFAAVATLLGANNAWINATDRMRENFWEYSQSTFWATGEPNDFGAGEDCTILVKSSALWNDVACNTGSRPYLCFNLKDSSWRVTPNNGNMANFGDGQNACEALNDSQGNEYLFRAPRYPWDNDAAAAASGSWTDVWINANDRITEGEWILNQYQYWIAGSPTPGPNELDCLTMDVSGHWQDRVCSGDYPVACFTGVNWYISTETTTLSNFASAQQLCSELGDGYRFGAPETVVANRQLRELISDLGLTHIWINGQDISKEGEWKFNQDGLPTPNWDTAQPDGEESEQCAYMDDDGLWHDQVCTVSRRVSCQNTTTGAWSISPNAQVLFTSGQVDLNAAHADCPSGSVFAAPRTFNENQALTELIKATAGLTEIWVNVSDYLIETRWLLNIGKEIDHSDLSVGGDNKPKCGVVDQYGDLSAVACDDVAKPYACSNGKTWRVTSASGLVSTTAVPDDVARNSSKMNFYLGHQACASEFGSDFIFAAPVAEDSIAKKQLAHAMALNGAVNAWLNVTDWFVSGQFRSNVGYQAFDATTDSDGCAYSDSSGIWLSDATCDSVAAHYACSNGESWQVAPADGTFDNPNLPQVGVDIWDQHTADTRCKELFGQSYRFSAPQSHQENQLLSKAISAVNVSNQLTWINYFGVRFWNGNGQQWVSDRFDETLVANIDVDQGTTREDCALMTRSGSTLTITDESCDQSHPVLCYNGSNWMLAPAAAWLQGAASCANEYSAEHLFMLPRDNEEREQVLSVISDGNSAWVNYSDISVESDWVANRPARFWWATSQPSNSGNRDCAVINADGTWTTDFCDLIKRPFACRKGLQWTVAGIPESEQGLWAQGHSACKSLTTDGGGWSYDFPQDYFANLNVITAADTLVNRDQNSKTAAEVLSEGLWINLTDQYSEGDWQRGRVYFDWAADFGFDDNEDCAYVDTATTELNDQAVQGTWFKDTCYAGDQPRAFACSNGITWKVTTTTNNHWNAAFSSGTDICETAFGAGYKFSAPETSFDNERLKQALANTGGSLVWINMQDVGEDGDWVANFTAPNLPPVVTFIAPSASIVQESSTGNNVRIEAVDPEGVGITSVRWLLDGVEFEAAAVCDSGNGQPGNLCVSNATYTAPGSLSKVITANVVAEVTDGDGKVTKGRLAVEVKPALVAAYDFNSKSEPGKDITGNGFNAIDDANLPFDFPKVESGAITFDLGSENPMRVQHFSTKCIANCDDGIPANDVYQPLIASGSAYSIAMQMYIYDSPLNNTDFRAVARKGDGGDRQPSLFLMPNNTSDALHTSFSTSGGLQAVNTPNSLPDNQWVNMILSVAVNGDVSIYQDGVNVQSGNVGALTYNAGEFKVGNSGGAPIGFTGRVDNVKVFNRAITTAQDAISVLPEPPIGRVQLELEPTVVDEPSTVVGTSTGVVKMVRERGYADAIRATYRTIDGSATVADGDYVAIAAATRVWCPLNQTGSVTLGGSAVTCNNDANGVVNAEVTITHNGSFKLERTEYLNVVVDSIERFDTASNTWVTYNDGFGSRYEAQLKIADVTPNPYGVLSFNTTAITCDEARSGFSDGTESGRLFKNCSVNILRNGTSEQIAVDLQANPERIRFTYDSGGTIDNGEDLKIMSANQTITFNNGEASKTLTFRVYQDDLYEPAESLQIVLFNARNLTNAVNAPRVGEPALMSLSVDDYSTGTIQFQTQTVTLREDSSTDVTYSIPVERFEGIDGSTNVSFSIAASSSKVTANDYAILTPSPLTWIQGDDSIKTIDVQVKADSVLWPSEREALSPCVVDGLTLPASDRRCFEPEFINITLSGSFVSTTDNVIKVSLLDGTTPPPTTPAVVKFTNATKMRESVSEREKLATNWSVNGSFNPYVETKPTVGGRVGTGVISNGSVPGGAEAIILAVDLNIGANANGLVWEQGGSGQGAYIGFSNGNLIVRAGSGAEWDPAVSGNKADLMSRLIIPASDVESREGTLYVEIEPKGGRLAAWFLERPVAASAPSSSSGQFAVELLGSVLAADGFESGSWHGSDDGALGASSSSTPVNEVVTDLANATAYRVRYFGLASDARPEYTQLVESSSDTDVNNHSTDFTVQIEHETLSEQVGVYIYVSGRGGAQIGAASASNTASSDVDINQSYSGDLNDNGSSTTQNFEAANVGGYNQSRIPIVLNAGAAGTKSYAINVFDDDRVDSSSNGVSFRLEPMLVQDDDKIDIGVAGGVAEIHDVKILDVNLPIEFTNTTAIGNQAFPSIPNGWVGDVYDENKKDIDLPGIRAVDTDWRRVRYIVELDTNNDGTFEDEHTKEFFSGSEHGEIPRIIFDRDNYPWHGRGVVQAANYTTNPTWQVRVSVQDDENGARLSTTFSFVLSPTWKQIDVDDTGGGCIVSNGIGGAPAVGAKSAAETTGCNGSTNRYWTYNPVTQQLVNRNGYHCLGLEDDATDGGLGFITGGADAFMRYCDPDEPSQKWIFSGRYLQNNGSGTPYRLCAFLFTSGLELNNGGSTCDTRFR